MSLHSKIIKGILGGVALVALIIFLSARTVACPITRESKEVRGASLGEELPEGTEVTLLSGYYKCHEPQRGEIIAYNASGYADPVIKVVKALPGDTFGLSKTDEGNRFIINGAVAKTFDGAPYSLSDNRYKFWKMYVDGFKGIVPPDAYILLGNVPSGSADSIKYGFITRRQFIGKIER